jgi:hydroxymethylpyrimidine kinase/phosphomethylpyrimidine kinase
MSAPYRDPDPVRRDVLICAGLDPSGGAGILADVRVASELGARPVGIVTALTVQNTTGVMGGAPIDAEVVSQQLACLLTDIELDAVKIGMIGSADVARAIATALQLTRAPTVWDPVMHPSRGELYRTEAFIDDALAALGPHLALLTPNRDELAYFAGAPIGSLSDATEAARALAARLEIAVLAKGGHLDEHEAIDVLVHAGGVEELAGPRVHDGHHVHGTGCALSTAIATLLAQGHDVVDACRAAKQYVAARIADPARAGRGAASVL